MRWLVGNARDSHSGDSRVQIPGHNDLTMISTKADAGLNSFSTFPKFVSFVLNVCSFSRKRPVHLADHFPHRIPSITHTQTLTHPYTHLPIHPYIHKFIHSLTHTLTHLSIHIFIQSLNHTRTHLSIRPYIHPLIHP